VSDEHSQRFLSTSTEVAHCNIVDSNLHVEDGSVACHVLAPKSDQRVEGEHLLCMVMSLLETCCISDIQSTHHRIIIDSGASSHMTPSKCLIRNINNAVNGSVSLGDVSKKLLIAGAGYTAMPILGLVYLVPELSFGLISIPTLDKAGCRTVFNQGRVYVFNSNSNLLFTGTLVGKLYYLDKQFVDKLYDLASTNEESSVYENVELDDYTTLCTD